jgi:coproporphyrinogen III oxidase-like Fe-S oxidoreductase
MAGDHLSLYQLTIEPETPFEALYKLGKLKVPDDELARDLYALTQELTAAAGLPAYEISNHARPGQESRHNLVYWRYGAYAGIGPGAHGRIIIDGVRHATSTERHPERWRDAVLREGHGITSRLALTTEEQADEALLMGLRLAEGVDLTRLAAIDGTMPASATIDGLIDLGLLRRIGNARIAATDDGRLVLNAVIRELSGALARAP